MYIGEGSSSRCDKSRMHLFLLAVKSPLPVDSKFMEMEGARLAAFSNCGIFTGIKYLIIVITFLSLSVVYK